MRLAFRYEVVQLGNGWMVFDRKNPEATPYLAKDERDAWVSADIWNILAGYRRQKRASND